MRFWGSTFGSSLGIRAAGVAKEWSGDGASVEWPDVGGRGRGGEAFSPRFRVLGAHVMLVVNE